MNTCTFFNPASLEYGVAYLPREICGVTVALNLEPESLREGSENSQGGLLGDIETFKEAW